MMRKLVLLGGLALVPFAGIDLTNLTDTPIIGREAIFGAAGAELARHGTGLKIEQRDGETVALTQKGFTLQFELELPPGMYVLSVLAQAPDRGTDSYWLAVNGKRVGGPLTLPVGRMGEGRATVAVGMGAKYRFQLSLREAPGSILKRVQLSRASIKIPRPAMRQELVGQHPRLLLTAADLDKLRQRLDDETVKRYYHLPSKLTKKPPPFRPGKRNGGAYRNLGSYALGYLLKPEQEQLTGILTWLQMATSFPQVGVDLDAEYFMEGLALTYDWLYDQIPKDLRTKVRDTIARQCRTVFQASLAGRQGGGLSFQQNHYWFAHLSLALGAAAICGEVPEADQWLAWAWDRYERIALSFSPDGGFHEGPGYWDYSMPTLYLYTDLYEWCTGLHIPAGDEGLKGQAQFRLHHVYPGLQRSAALEDSGTSIGRPPTKVLLWQAKRYNDPVAAGIAELLNRGPSSDRFNLLWLNEQLAPRDPRQAVPPARHYPDVETVFARSSWDDDATYVAFVSRPLGGHLYADLCAQFGLSGTGHNHPEQNHFVLFARGEVLAGDPGYTYKKMTRNHNTILVDGKGQFGDGEMWPRPNPGRSHITSFVTKGDITIATGDATSAYPAELGLTRFERTLVLAGRDLVVVYDRLAAQQPRTFSWLLHHYGKLTADQSARPGAWTITRGKAELRVAPVLPTELVADTSTYRPQYIHPTRNLTPKEADVNLLELRHGPAAETTFLVPLLIGDSGGKLAEAENVSTDSAHAVRVGNILVAFNRGERMTLDLPWGEQLTTEAKAVVARLHRGQRDIVTAP